MTAALAEVRIEFNHIKIKAHCGVQELEAEVDTFPCSSLLCTLTLEISSLHIDCISNLFSHLHCKTEK